jgi:hypothetical protein
MVLNIYNWWKKLVVAFVKKIISPQESANLPFLTLESQFIE